MHRLEISNVIDFLSKGCKDNEHQKCYGNWVGLGFRVDCNCLCHHENKTIDTKSGKFGETVLESNNNMSKSKSHAQVDVYIEMEYSKNNIKPVDKSFRGFQSTGVSC